MADDVSAVGRRLASRATAEPEVRLAEIRPTTLVQLASWPDALPRAEAAAADAAGMQVAPGPGRSATGATGTLLRVEPLKWWLLDGSGAPPSLAPDTGAVLDLSHSRTRLHIDGPRAATLLNHVLPLDLSLSAFPEGAVASTAFHHVGVTLWKRGAGFDLFLPRSFAASLCEILIETAAQYGPEIAGSPRVTSEEGPR